MGLPSGSFADATAGQLDVTFSAEFFSVSGGDWGSGPGLYLIIKCTVNDGSSDVAVGYIKNGAPSLALTMAYPGGSVGWTLSMTYEAHSLSGPSTIGAENCKISAALFKRA